MKINFLNFNLMFLIYRIKILILRIIGYEKPLRVAFLKLLQLKYKTFRPNYETILYESSIEAKKLGYKEITVLELGVAGGNGIISLEKYKKKIEKILDIKITIFGFDSGEGLPITNIYQDLPFNWKSGLFKTDQELLHKKINSKIIYGDINNTMDEFLAFYPKNISAIFFDFDYYSSTKNFLNQIKKLQKFMSPRIYCYFDDVYHPNLFICNFNGELLAIKEFNDENDNIKIANPLDSICDFKFPLAKNMLWIMHKFDHEDYNKYIGSNNENSLSIGNRSIDSGNIF
jgi:hypothetical protein